MAGCMICGSDAGVHESVEIEGIRVQRLIGGGMMHTLEVRLVDICEVCLGGVNEAFTLYWDGQNILTKGDDDDK
jgi:hypothetical protein